MSPVLEGDAGPLGHRGALFARASCGKTVDIKRKVCHRRRCMISFDGRATVRLLPTTSREYGVRQGVWGDRRAVNTPDATVTYTRQKR